MKNLIAVALSVATAAWAGETFIGSIYASDAGSANNASTGYGSAGCAPDVYGAAACDQAFRIGLNAKLTIRCPDACLVSVNRATTDAGVALPLAADEKFPTSVSPNSFNAALPDGGSYQGGLVSIIAVPGSSTCRCRVFTRSDTE